MLYLTEEGFMFASRRIVSAAALVLTALAVTACSDTVQASPRTLTLPTEVDVTTQVTATYTPGSGFYLTSPNATDGRVQLSGSLVVDQALTVTGTVTGLAPRTPFVTVPYRDGECLPLAGVTAFPSGGSMSDASGTVTFDHVPVNPAAINPVGSLAVGDINSVSVRQLLVSPIPLPGVPAGTPYLPGSTPGVPNVALPEGCDKNPVKG